MDLDSLRQKQIHEFLDIDAERFPRVISFVNFGNVNYWFSNDDRDENGELFVNGQKLIINLEKLKSLVKAKIWLFRARPCG